MQPANQTPDDTDEDSLWSAFKAGSAAAREALFNRHMAFARNIARRHHRERSSGDLDIADLRQLAFSGLLEALDRFDPARGIPFRAYAAHRISGSISDGIARMSEVREQLAWRRRAGRDRLNSLADDWSETMSTAEAMERLAQVASGLALGFMLEGTGLFADDDAAERPAAPATAYDSLAWKEIVAQLGTELAALPERERTILKQHYVGGLDFDHIASLLAISKGRVSQLHRAALALLRKRLAARGHFRLGG